MYPVNNPDYLVAISVLLVGIAILLLCLVLLARLPRIEKKSDKPTERATDWESMCQALQRQLQAQSEANEQYLENVHTALGTSSKRVDELSAKNQTLFDENAQLHADKIALNALTTAADGIKWQDHAVIERHARVSIVRGIEKAVAQHGDGNSDVGAERRLAALIQEIQQSVEEAEQIRTKSKETPAAA